MDAPAGTAIGFAAAPGAMSVTADGPNSVYTAALATLMRQPALISNRSSKACACRGTRRPPARRCRGWSRRWTSICNSLARMHRPTRTPQNKSLLMCRRKSSAASPSTSCARCRPDEAYRRGDRDRHAAGLSVVRRSASEIRICRAGVQDIIKQRREADPVAARHRAEYAAGLLELPDALSNGATRPRPKSVSPRAVAAQQPAGELHCRAHSRCRRTITTKALGLAEVWPEDFPPLTAGILRRTADLHLCAAAAHHHPPSDHHHPAATAAEDRTPACRHRTSPGVRTMTVPLGADGPTGPRPGRNVRPPRARHRVAAASCPPRRMTGPASSAVRVW